MTKAQQRILDYLSANTSGEFIVVPSSVCNDVRTFDTQEWRPSSLPPGSFEMVYRAASSQNLSTPASRGAEGGDVE